MNSKNRLDDRLNALLVAAVVVLSIGLNISVLAEGIVEAAQSVRAVAASVVVTPASQVTALSMAVQMPR